MARRRAHGSGPAVGILPALGLVLAVGFLALGGVGSLGGCYFILDWDTANLPCLNDQCSDGFTCLVNKCVPDQSLAEGDTCNNPAQCEEGLTCATKLFTCLKSCSPTAFFSVSADCEGSGKYCRPVVIKEAQQPTRWEGYCVRGDGCRTDTDCLGNLNGKTCVHINSTTSACLPGCTITWEGTNADMYSDNCGGLQSEPKYCQPIGRDGDQRLVCLDTTPVAPGLGNPCQPVDLPCASGLLCWQGACHAYCNTTCTSGSCVGVQGDANTSFGVCTP